MSDTAEPRVTWGPSPKPSPREIIAQHRNGTYVQTNELTADELDRVRRWRRATREERGVWLADVLKLAGAMKSHHHDRPMFPGWPREGMNR